MSWVDTPSCGHPRSLPSTQVQKEAEEVKRTEEVAHMESQRERKTGILWIFMG